MKGKLFIVVFIALFALTFIVPDTEAQLLKKFIKAKGGGDSDIVKLCGYIPEKATILISVNWQSLAATGIFDQLKNMAAEDTEILESMGLDIKNDPKHLILGIEFVDEGELTNTYVVVAGKFDEQKILNVIKEESGEELEKTKVGKTTVYQLEDSEFAFVPDGILLGSSEEGESLLKKMLQAGEKSLANNEKMVNLIKNTDTNATIWAAVQIPESLKEEMGMGEAEEIGFEPENVEAVTFSMDYAKMITTKIDAHFNNEKDASGCANYLKKSLEQMLSEEAAMAMPPAMVEIMKKIQISPDKKAVKISVNVEREKLEKMITDMMGAMGGGMMVPEEEEVEEEEEMWEED